MTFMLPATWSEFLARHWVIGGIGASLLWCLAGKQSLSNRNVNGAIAWQSVGLLLILILAGWTIKEGQWVGLVCALLVFSFEVWTISRSSTAVNG